MSAAIFTAFARFRPSKRKLDDYASSPAAGDLTPVSGDPSPIYTDPALLVAMPKPAPSSPSNNVSDGPDAAATSSSTIHFFVRADSRTLVIHAGGGDTVDSIIARVATVTGALACDQRLIFSGRQLPGDRTLDECSVRTDSCLHLVGRLRSTRFPRAWQVANDLLASVSWLISNGYGKDRLRASTEISYVDDLLKQFLAMAPSPAAPTCVGEDDTGGHLQVFVLAGTPVALIKLYLSRTPGYPAIAEGAIRLFLTANSEYLPKPVHGRCAPIVLEFCKLLAATAGKSDPLYVACRGALASLVETQDWRRVSYSKSVASVISELFLFVQEMAEILMGGLSSESMSVRSADLTEFSNFLLALRRVIRDWMCAAGPIPKPLYDGAHAQYGGWIKSLHAIFMDLLKKVDQCLKKVAGCLEQKDAALSDFRWAGWSHILIILTELNSFSQIYEGVDELLHAVLLAQRQPVNALIRRAKRNDNLLWLLKHKDVTDFEARRNLVMMMFPDKKDDYLELHEMLIDRSQLLAESFEYIGQANARALRGGLFMEFKNEEATGPGVLREWFCLVCRAIFDPQNVLFLPCANDRRRFFPNPASAVDPLHLKYFRFCGRVIALALMHKVQVGIVFDRVFFLQLAGKSLTLEDIQTADPCLYISCKQILEMDVNLLDSDALGLTFVREFEELGNRKVVELCPGGKDIVVNSKNREEYINLLIEHCFVTSTSEQILRFSQGFGDILADSKLQKLFFQSMDLEDFDRMLGGSDNVISVRDWKAHTEYNGYKAKDRQICWFWKVVEGMSAEQQRVLLFFWTSVKYLPVDGFGGLASKLYIYKASESHDHLPTSQTCFYRLRLPSYPSISIMRNRLQMITQEHISCTFGMW